MCRKELGKQTRGDIKNFTLACVAVFRTSGVSSTSSIDWEISTQLWSVLSKSVHGTF